MAIVTLTTDFGTVDGYAGEMKGVVLSLAPSARLVDVTHAVAQGDVRGGAWVLGRIWRRFPPEAVHLAVVDPGVGGDRGAVAARVDGRWFVGPDNGLLTLVLRDGEEAGTARALDPDRAGLEEVSDTFHGRDLFAPVAARLAHGDDPPGSAVPPSYGPDAGGELAEVIYVDGFGNAMTGLCAPQDRDRTLRAAGRDLPGVRTFADVEPGGAMWLVNSIGLVEIAVNQGSAAADLELRVGTAVHWREKR